MKRTIIYVFTPKRLQKDYQSGILLPDDSSGWVKIGQTSSDDDKEDKWDVAYNRIKQETHTGISEPCVLVEVFEYPELKGNSDDIVRNLLTSEKIFRLSGSHFQNQQVNPLQYEIKAGREYVYGVTKHQVLTAIAKFERDLLIDDMKPEQLKTLVGFIKKNHETSIEDSDESNISDKSDRYIHFYETIVEYSGNDLNKITHPNNKNYMYISSKNADIKSYTFTISRRYNQALIAIETIGEEKMQRIEDFIRDNNIRDFIKLSLPIPGVKNKNKYSWRLIKGFDYFSEVHMSEWFESNIKKLIKIFDEKDLTCLEPCPMLDDNDNWE